MANNNMDPEKGLVTGAVWPVVPSLASSAPDNTNINEFSKHTPLQLPAADQIADGSRHED